MIIINNVMKVQTQLGDYEIAWVDSEVGKTENGTLSLLPLSTTAPPHKSVLVGDLKMANFKQFLADNGVQVPISTRHLKKLSFKLPYLQNMHSISVPNQKMWITNRKKYSWKLSYLLDKIMQMSVPSRLNSLVGVHCGVVNT